MKTVKKKSELTTVPNNNHSNNAANNGVTKPTKDKNVAVYFLNK